MNKSKPCPVCRAATSIWHNVSDPPIASHDRYLVKWDDGVVGTGIYLAEHKSWVPQYDNTEIVEWAEIFE